MIHHYSLESLISALIDIGIKKGDIIFSHSNIGYLGIPEGECTVENACSTILKAFLEVIGNEGTLCVPTFTYSFSQNKIFDPDITNSDCGIFTEYIRKHPNSYRSEDPCVSVSAIGKDAKRLTENIPVNAYGDNCFFNRFHRLNGKICNMNFDAGSTFIHYFERKLKVPYRFDKTFSGTMIKCNKSYKRNSTIWVRYLTDGTSPKFEPFDLLAKKKHYYKTAKIGRGMIGSITVEDTYHLIKETISKRPWFLTEAEELGIIPDFKNAKK